MNPLIASLASKVVRTVATMSLKKQEFSYGRFTMTRTSVLISVFLALVLSISLVGLENTEEAVDMLDTVSDIIGYE